MRATKRLYRTLLIVCEGDSTEPTYFNRLGEVAMDREVYSYIEIYPTPREIEEAEERERARNEGRKVRQFSRGEKGLPERTVEPADEDEQAFVKKENGKEIWATPVRYIKEARDRVKEKGYDEAWAVFDMDGHASPDKAHELAEILVDNKKINIAFSAISFEHWILMHFERNDYAFKKSQCKDSETEKSKDCGMGVHDEDCSGKICVSGHMIAQKYIEGYNKSKPSDLVKTLIPLTENAIQNAAWLRAVQGHTLSKNPVWEINPFTNVDELVKRMFGIQTTHFAIVSGVALTLDQIEFKLQSSEAGFHLSITNNTGSRITLNQFTLTMAEAELQRPDVGLVENTQIIVWDLPNGAKNQVLTLNFSNNVISLYVNEK